jgi:hypothetical protein
MKQKSAELFSSPRIATKSGILFLEIIEAVGRL